MFKLSALIHLASIAGTRLLGPYFLPPRLTGALYQDLLLKHLELLQDADLQTMIHLWFM
jgi:hypothetical protein